MRIKAQVLGSFTSSILIIPLAMATFDKSKTGQLVQAGSFSYCSGFYNSLSIERIASSKDMFILSQ